MHPIKDFNYKCFIEVAEELLRSDETLMALKVLDMVPGYFRDHKIVHLENLKKEIRAKIATSSFYATHVGCEVDMTDEACLSTASNLRNIIISEDVRRSNEQKLTPHICDMGPGEGSLPMVLKAQNLNFTYEQIYVNEPTRQTTLRRFQDKLGVARPEDPLIFVSTEVIEHLHCEQEIKFEADRLKFAPDVVHVSTPLYTYAPSVKNWRDIGWLGHLRTYTPAEFRKVVGDMFFEYAPAYYESQVQHIRLYRPDSKFDCLKNHYQFQNPEA